MFKKCIFISVFLNLTACSLIPPNNDSIIPADTPTSKIITIIQKDQVIKTHALHKDIITTNLKIDNDRIRRYFKTTTVARRYPAPKSIFITCRHSTAGITRWNTHYFTEKLEEGKTYTFMCQGIDSYKVTVGNFAELKQ